MLFTGAGSVFTVGGDLRFIAQPPRLDATLREIITPFHAALSIFDALSAPIVAGVKGAVAGGGLGLIYVSDIVIAAPETKFAAGFAALGLTGDGSGTYFLPRLAGPKRAAEFYLEQRVLTADEAVDWGLATRVGADVDAEALRVATQLASGPTMALGKVRRLLRESWDRPLAAQLVAELEAMGECGASEDAPAAIASFLNKQKPTFQGR